MSEFSLSQIRTAPKISVLTGPTACGKSAVALCLAESFNAEILSIDSMKVYRGLDIGTAKPGRGTRAARMHHLIDIKDAWESFCVAEFIQAAESTIAACAQRGTFLLGEGGTPMYLKALSEGLFAGPGRDAEIRAKLEAEAAALGTPALHARLAGIDPKAAARILISDLRRIVRALEVHSLTGQPISHFQSQWGVPRTDLDVRLFCLQLPRVALYPRIDRRIGKMLEAGWLEECKRLLDLSGPRPISREASQALGYRTLFAHLRGEMTLAAAKERICFDTHHFARRQIGWFKRMPNITFIEIEEDEPAEQIADRLNSIFTDD